MPAQSAAQRRWAYGVKGKAWAEAHHFDTPGKLPERVKHQAGTTNVGLALFRAQMAKHQKHKK